MNSKITFKKGLCSLVLLLFALFVSFVMSNHVYAADSDFVVDENGVLTKYNGTGGDVDIPDSVTSIGDLAFYRCTNLTTLVIPDSVTSIGNEAFSYCSSLTTIDIPNSVTSIGMSTFSYCSSLTAIDIPDSVTSIGDWAFSFCYSLTAIDIPDLVTSIGNFTFNCCTNLTTIDIPDSVTSIENGAFSYCTSLTSIDIPDSVTSIGEFAFSKCNLKSIEIPDSVTSIGNEAFKYCSHLAIIINNNKIIIGYRLADPNITTLYGNKNSTTEQYAKENGYKFRLIGEIPLTSISLQKTNINIAVGKTSLNSVIYNPTDTTDDKTVKWTSSNPNVVQVYSTGKVKGISKGTAIITAQVGEFTATCTVTVN